MKYDSCWQTRNNKFRQRLIDATDAEAMEIARNQLIDHQNANEKEGARMYREYIQNSSPLDVTVRSDTSLQKNTKTAGFAPIEALLVILVIWTIATGCSPCQVKKTLENIEKITAPLIRDKNSTESNNNEKTKKTEPSGFKEELQKGHKSQTCQRRIHSPRRDPLLMPCYHPLQAWHAKTKNESGKRSLVFNPKQAYQADAPIEISCGQCIGCRLERSRQWATRCLHEASLYEDNCFITLTFNPEELKKRENPQSLDVRDFQLFMKKLRKKYGAKIRFFHCGEYGDHSGRPHYHACIFNFDFPDKKIYKQVENKNTETYKLYTSESLNKIWGKGYCIIGDVTFESAAYVARYIMKKITGSQADQHYEYITDDGEILDRKPEYTTMSRRPGIGKGWYDKFITDLYPSDFLIVNQKKCRVPKYYDGLYEFDEPYLYDMLKEKRANKMDEQEYKTVRREETLEKIQKLRIKSLQRNHDEREIT